MSKFLGPIHHWLYAKIGHQEALTAAIAQSALEAGWLEDAAPYCRELPPLENAIDGDNIHGWLQGQIHQAESRFAQLIRTLTAADPRRMEEIRQTALAFGRSHGFPQDTDAQQAYQAFESFFLNGMPCDRVNMLTRQGPEATAWELTEDIHAAPWAPEGTAPYYDLRRAVMEGMMEGTSLTLDMPDPFHYVIRRKG